MAETSYRIKKINRHIILLAAIIVVTACWQMSLTDEPLFLQSRFGLVRPVHTAILSDDLYNNGFNPFKTEVFYKGGKGTYTQEFPLYNLVIAFLYKIFGVDYRIGVWISIVCFAAALVFLYLFFVKYAEQKRILGLIFLIALAPHSLFYGRMYIPLSFDLMLLTANLYFFKRFLENQSWGRFSISFVILLLHLLQKGIFIVMGLVMVIMAYQELGKGLLKNIKLWLLAVIPNLLMGAWYIYGLVVSVPVKEGFGNRYFLPLNMIFNLEHQLYTWKWFFISMVYLFTAPGLVLAIAGLFLIKDKSFRRIVIAWIIAFAIFGFLFPRVWKAHEYYHIFIAPAFAIGLVNAVALAAGKYRNTALRRVLIGALLCFFMLQSFFKMHSEFRMNPISFIEPTSNRISNLTEPDSKFLFIGDDLGVWEWEWQFATKRTGYQTKFTSSADSIMERAAAGKVSHIALVRWHYDYFHNPQPLHFSVRHNLFREYRLADSCLDEYLLFDTDMINTRRIADKQCIKINSKAAGGLILAGILLEGGNFSAGGQAEEKYTDVTFFWQLEKRVPGNLYLLVIDTNNRIHPVSHKIMSNALPLKYWRKRWLYSERVRVSSTEALDPAELKNFSYYIYDRTQDRIYAATGAIKDDHERNRLISSARDVVKKESAKAVELFKSLKAYRFTSSKPEWY